MNCWAVLELDASASLKDIKKSYAKKLKSNKPDENPEGFQRLNSAYQEACRIAKQKARQQAYEEEHAEQERLEKQSLLEEQQSLQENLPEFSEPDHLIDEVDELDDFEDDEWQENTEWETKEIYLKDVSLTVPIIERELSVQQEDSELANEEEQTSYGEDDLINDVEALMESESLNDLSKWKPLLNSPLLYEIRFRGWFTLRLFYLVSDKLEAEKEQAKEAEDNKDIEQTTPVLKQATLNFLNEKMMWTHQVDRLESHFDHDELVRVIERLKPSNPKANPNIVNASTDEEESKKDHASIFKRLAAFIIDNLIFAVGVSLIAKMNAVMPEDIILESTHLLGINILWMCILFPYMESTLQASPGKWLVGIKVVSRKGKKLNYFHALIRLILCIVNIIGFKITIFLNAFMYDGRLLHDKISYSKVVNRSNDS